MFLNGTNQLKHLSECLHLLMSSIEQNSKLIDGVSPTELKKDLVSELDEEYRWSM